MKKYPLLVITFLLALSLFAQQKTQGTAKPTKGRATKRAPIDTSKFVLVEGGIYTMGTDQPKEWHEAPAHKVTVKSFYIAKTEVTYDDYDKYTSAIKRDSIPFGWGRGKQPAIVVSWTDAVHYCNWLSEKEKLSKCYEINEKDNTVKYLDTAKGYRLPTEAEWEFAARGGNNSKGYTYAGSNDLNSVGWFLDNSNAGTKPVGQKAPNELGLYDMNGNVWEWCWDIYDGGYYKTSPPVDPEGPPKGPYRVMRGGAFYNKADYTRLVTRQNSYEGFKQNSVGFRVARTYFD